MKKKLSLLLVCMLLISTLTGCMQMETRITINKDGSGQMKVNAAVNKEMMKDFSQTENEELIDLGDGLENVPGIKIQKDILKYTDNGQIYEGESVVIDVSDIKSLIKQQGTTGQDDIIILELPNGDNRIEINVANTSSEKKSEKSSENGVETETELDMDFDIYGVLAATGGKFEYSIETDNEVVKHNAQSVKGNIYTWDLIKLAMDSPETEKLTMFVEYKVNYELSDVKTSRERIEHNLLIDLNDKDFHGKALNKLGILRGTDNGLELDKVLTRAEGLVMYTRLLGLEEEAFNFAKSNPEYTTPFTDIPTWVKPYINYLYKEGLVKGISDVLYGSSRIMSEQEYSTLVLRALGYKEGLDFTWDKANIRAVELGLYNNDKQDFKKVLGLEFNRRKMSYISYNALFHKDIIGIELISKFTK